MFDAYAFSIASVFPPASYFSDFGRLASNVLTILVSAAGALAIIFIIISGIKLVTASGDSKKMASATSTLTYSLIGLAVVILAFIIIQVLEAFFGATIIGGGPGGPGGGGGPGSPACTIDISSVAAGGSVTVTSVNSLFGSIGIQGGYGSPVFSGLGTLTAGGSTPITVPAAAPLGLYIVRVGGYGVGCTPNLTVIAGGFTLDLPSVSSYSVSFSFTPSNGNIALVVKDSIGNIVHNSSTLAIGTASAQWNTDVLVGNYTATLCFAFCSPPSSNTVNFSVSYIPPTCSQMDFDHDNQVTILDGTRLASAFPSTIGDPKYNIIYDLNRDGKIDNQDINIIQPFIPSHC